MVSVVFVVEEEVVDTVGDTLSSSALWWWSKMVLIVVLMFSVGDGVDADLGDLDPEADVVVAAKAAITSSNLENVVGFVEYAACGRVFVLVVVVVVVVVNLGCCGTTLVDVNDEHDEEDEEEDLNAVLVRPPYLVDDGTFCFVL